MLPPTSPYLEEAFAVEVLHGHLQSVPVWAPAPSTQLNFAGGKRMKTWQPWASTCLLDSAWHVHHRVGISSLAAASSSKVGTNSEGITALAYCADCSSKAVPPARQASAPLPHSLAIIRIC
mmetsp:Transcript_27760/g.54506  ORF Transcript_27760/g.54506 Transcript_27760/m.54506 type:complete len:121 (-) Transcript_27760:51-413(-)